MKSNFIELLQFLRTGLMPCIGLLLAGCKSEKLLAYGLPDALIDGSISIQKIQVFGTHNSYHQLPDFDVIEEWNYAHLPLEDQLVRGIRQFELDVVYDPNTQTLLVQHFPFLDANSSCYSFVDCLTELSSWSMEHDEHVPIHVLIEPKTEYPPWSTTNHLDEFDEIIEAVFGERIWTPAKQQGEQATLRDSVFNSGFPDLDEMRGKFIFVLLDSGEPFENYTTNGTDLTDRVMFPLVAPDHEMAAYFLRDNPYHEEISILSDAGFLVRTRADSAAEYDVDRLQAATSGDANAISMDSTEGLSSIDPLFPFRLLD